VTRPFVCGCLTSCTVLRFHIPLIEPDVRISRIRLSDGLHRPTHRYTRQRTFRRPIQLFPRPPNRCLGLLDLAVNPQAVGRFHSAPEVRPLPSTGITRLPRYYEPVRHPSAARPVPRGRPVGNAIVPPLGLPVLPVDSPCTHAIASTPAGPVEVSSLVTRPAAAFPIGPAGRLPHCAFRGLLGVHSRYGLRAR
jgi:hypothetical protein